MSNDNMYFSPTGGTKKVVDLLTGALSGGYQEMDLRRETVPMTSRLGGYKENHLFL